MQTEAKQTVSEIDLDAANDIFGSDDALIAPTPSLPSKLGEVSGEMSRSDIRIPRLNLVQSVGPLSQTYKKGQWLLGKEQVIAEPGEEMMVIVLSLTKFFQERLDYDPNGPRPRIFPNEAAVFAEGLTLEWKDNGPGKKSTPPTAEPIARVVMLIHQTQTLDAVFFPLDIEGTKWTIVEWMVRRTAYARAAKSIFRARALELQESGLLAGLWTLKSTSAIVNGNNISVPVLSLIGRNDAKRIERIKTLCSGAI